MGLAFSQMKCKESTEKLVQNYKRSRLFTLQSEVDTVWTAENVKNYQKLAATSTSYSFSRNTKTIKT